MMSKEIRKKGLDKLSVLLKILTVIVLLLFILCIVKTCVDCRRINEVTIVDRTGYLPDQENWDNIPDVEPPYDDDELDSLPEAVSLEQFFLLLVTKADMAPAWLGPRGTI